MADIPSSVLDDPHVQQELRRILYKNVLSAEVAAMHRSGSAPASMDGMLQRNADVDYDQRSRFASLGGSPSDTFLQESCFDNREDTSTLISYLSGARHVGSAGQQATANNIASFWPDSSQGAGFNSKSILNSNQGGQALDAFLQAAYKAQDQAVGHQASQAEQARHHFLGSGDLNTAVSRDNLAPTWQEASDVMGSSYSSPRHIGNVIGTDRQFTAASNLQGLQGLSASEGLSDELFASASNSPRGHVSDIALGSNFKSADNSLLGSGRHNLFRDPKVTLSTLVGSSTPRAVERHGPSKLRIGSNDTYLDLSSDSLNGVNQQASEASLLPQPGASFGGSRPAPNNISSPGLSHLNNTVNEPTVSAGTNSSSQAVGEQPPVPSAQQLHSMYMAAAAMYPFYSQHSAGHTPLPPSPSAAFQSYMMGAFPPYGFPYLYSQQLPPGAEHSSSARPFAAGMPPHLYPPMPFPPPEYAREYAAYYQKFMEAHAAALHGFPNPAAAMAMAAAAAATKDLSKDQQHREYYTPSSHASSSSGARTGSNDLRRSRDGYPQQTNLPTPRHSRRGSKPSASGSATLPLRPQDSPRGDPPVNALLEEFKTNKQRKFEVRDIMGQLFEFSLDQHGSRFIQQKLETLNTYDYDAALDEILPRALTLMTDVFGNYVIQKFLEHGSSAARLRLCEQLSGHVLHLSLHMYGCRVVQKVVEVAGLTQQLAIVAELDAHVMRCVKDQNGNHVIQKVIECIPSDKIAAIIDTFLPTVVPLSTHPFGCRVIQRILEHCSDAKKRKIAMDEILRATVQLAQDQYGNYVIQHVLEHGAPDERDRVVRQLAPQIVTLSQHKFASNVVEKCLLYSAPAERAVMVEAMLGPDGDEAEQPLHAMMRDQFGNYVVQKLLEVCDEQQREVLLQRVRAQLHSLKKYTYGKHIVARVEKLLSTGTKMQNSARLRSLQLQSHEPAGDADSRQELAPAGLADV